MSLKNLAVSRRKRKSGNIRRASAQLPSLELIRQILRGEKPTDSTTLKPTGRYFVSAATFKGLLLAVKDMEQRVSGSNDRGVAC